MKKIILLCEDGYKYKYPQVPDLAELLADREIVSVAAPSDPDSEQWNKGRGFLTVPIELKFKSGTLKNLEFCIRSIILAWDYDTVIACTTVSLLPALVARLFLRKQIAYYALECQIPGEPKSGRFAFFQLGLKYVDCVIATTGHTRSKAIKRLLRLPRLPISIENAALLPQTAAGRAESGDRLDQQSLLQTLAPRAFDARCNGKRLVAINGGIADINCIVELLAAIKSAPSSLHFIFWGPIESRVRADFLLAMEQNSNCSYAGKISGNRQVIIDLLTTTTFGLVLKKTGRTECLNDRLYTPNKIFDYLTAGSIPLTTRNIPLRKFARDGLTIEIATTASASIGATLTYVSRLTDDEVTQMKQRISNSVSNIYNFKDTALPFIQAIRQASQ